MPHEHYLAGSFFGKYFARALNLQLLKRDPDRWRDVQSGAGASAGTKDVTANSKPSVQATGKSPHAGEVTNSAQEGSKKRKRTSHKDDEIEELFEATLGWKVKKAELKPAPTEGADPKSRGLEDVQQKEDKTVKAGKKSKKGVKDGDKDLQGVLGAIKAAPKDDKVKGKKGKKKDR